MQKALIIYAIIQLMTTAYGLSVIESIRPMVERKLIEQGYKKNKNSLYSFSYTITNVLKGFIPFYYLGKSISIISNKNAIEDRVNEQIKAQLYVEAKEEKENEEFIEDASDSIYKSPFDMAFEKPDKYVARKNDIVTLYDTYETPVDYIERVSKKDDDIELTPFVNNDKVVEHVVVKEEVSKSDIANALASLSPNELELLNKKIIELAELKKQQEYKLKLEKDVA